MGRKGPPSRAIASGECGEAPGVALHHLPGRRSVIEDAEMPEFEYEPRYVAYLVGLARLRRRMAASPISAVPKRASEAGSGTASD